MQADTGRRGRPYSSYMDRFVHTFLVIRNGISSWTAIIATLLSHSSNSRHFEHTCWAIVRCAERDAEYALMPQMLRDYMASRGYNPDKICVFAASDDGNTLLAPDGAPEMRCAYWSYKK